MSRVTPRSAAPPQLRPPVPPLWRQVVSDYVVALARVPGGVVVATGDGALTKLTEAGQPAWQVAVGSVGITALAVSDEAIAACTMDGRLGIYAHDGAVLHHAVPGGTLTQLAWNHEGSRLAVAQGRGVMVMDRRGAGVLRLAPLPATLRGLAWRGADLLGAGYGGVWRWQPAAGGLGAPRLYERKGAMLNVALSPDGRVMACGTQENTIVFWRLPDGEPSQMQGYGSKPSALAWDRASKLLATGGNNEVVIWNFGKGPEGTRPIELSAHASAVTQVAFAPQGELLASAASDGAVLVWQPRKRPQPIAYCLVGEVPSALGWLDGARLVVGDAAGGVQALAMPT